MDPDDYYPGKGTINRMLKAAITNGADICGGSLQLIDKNGTMIDRSRSRDNYGYYFDQEGMIDYRDYQFDYCYVRFIYRRSLLEKHKLRFPELRRFEDPVFMVKAFAAAGCFYALRESTYVYRAGNGFAKVNWTAENCYMARQKLIGMKMVIEFAELHGYENLIARRIRNLIQGSGEVFWRDDVQSALGDELYLLVGKYARKAFVQSETSRVNTKAAQLKELRSALDKTRADRDAKSAKLQEFREALDRARADRDAKSAKLQEFREALDRARADRDAKSAKLQEFREALDRVRADRDAKSAKLQEFRVACKTAKETVVMVREQRDALIRVLKEIVSVLGI